MVACKRCGEVSVLESRGEAFCKDCFIRFLNHKQLKQTENYKVNYRAEVPDTPHLVLALSLGPASLALLHMCADTIKKQRLSNRGRQGYILHAVVVDETVVKGEIDKNIEEVVKDLRDRFPEVENFDILRLEQDADSLPIEISSGIQASPLDTLKTMSRTSRQDTATTMKEQLISTYTKARNATTIYGHTQTRLAEEVISLTAKGRGNTIPEMIEMLYPLRDVLNSEVAHYNRIEDLDKHVVQYTSRVPSTTKLQSINELVHNYFVSVEDGFPSVVATVVRTAAKLHIGETTQRCAVCQGPMEEDTLDWIKGITVNAPSEDQSTLLCYGCVVMFRGSVGTVSWPRYDAETLLKQYEL